MQRSQEALEMPTATLMYLYQFDFVYWLARNKHFLSSIFGIQSLDSSNASSWSVLGYIMLDIFYGSKD